MTTLETIIFVSETKKGYEERVSRKIKIKEKNAAPFPVIPSMKDVKKIELIEEDGSVYSFYSKNQETPNENN